MTTGALQCCRKGITFEARMYNSFGDLDPFVLGVEFLTGAPCGDAGTQFPVPHDCEFPGVADTTVDVVVDSYPASLWFVHWLVTFENGAVLRIHDRPYSFSLSDGIVSIYAMFFGTDEDLPTCEDIRLHVPARIKIVLPPTIPLAEHQWIPVEDNPTEEYPGPFRLLNYQRFEPHPEPDEVILSCRDRFGILPFGLPLPYLSEELNGGEAVTYAYTNASKVCATAYVSSFWLQHRPGTGQGFTGISAVVCFVTLLDTDGPPSEPNVPIPRLLYLESFNIITQPFTQDELFSIYQGIPEHSPTACGHGYDGKEYRCLIAPPQFIPPTSPLHLYPSNNGALEAAFQVDTAGAFTWSEFYASRLHGQLRACVYVPTGACFCRGHGYLSPSNFEPKRIWFRWDTMPGQPVGDWPPPYPGLDWLSCQQHRPPNSSIPFQIEAASGSDENDVANCRCPTSEWSESGDVPAEGRTTSLLYTAPGSIEAEPCELQCQIAGEPTGISADAFPARLKITLPESIDLAWRYGSECLDDSWSGKSTRHTDALKVSVIEASCPTSGIGDPVFPTIFQYPLQLDPLTNVATGIAMRLNYEVLEDVGSFCTAYNNVDLEIGVVKPWATVAYGYPYTAARIRLQIKGTGSVFYDTFFYAFKFGPLIDIVDQAALDVLTPWLLNTIDGFDPDWDFSKFYIQRYGKDVAVSPFKLCEYSIDPGAWDAGYIAHLARLGGDNGGLACNTAMSDFCPSASGGCDLSGFPELSTFEKMCMRGINHMYQIHIEPTTDDVSVVFCDFPTGDTYMLFCDEDATSCP